MNYLKLDWSNSCDLGRVYYSGGFTNTLYLDAEIGKPEYSIEEEGFENGDGVFIKTRERLIKNYKFEIVVPEYIADALVFMALHDNIRISYTNGLYSSTVRNVKVNVNWEDITNSCLAIVEVSFQQDDQILKGNCCIPLS